MIRTTFISLAILLTCGGTVAQPRPPVVVELYQSQGCSSCPPADFNLNALADRPDVFALSFAVTYWDDLGWKDTFASPSFTRRQWDYAHGVFHRREVATPQVVINGRSDLVGNNRAQLDAAIAKAPVLPGPAVSFAAGKVTIAKGPAAQADVWLVRYDSRLHQVPVARGENAGKTLPHRNIVRELVRLGPWTGAPAGFALPAARDPALKTAVLVQGKAGGAILSAVKL
jgi:hypothetical protein